MLSKIRTCFFLIILLFTACQLLPARTLPFTTVAQGERLDEYRQEPPPGQEIYVGFAVITSQADIADLITHRSTLPSWTLMPDPSHTQLATLHTTAFTSTIAIVLWSEGAIWTERTLPPVRITQVIPTENGLEVNATIPQPTPARCENSPWWEELLFGGRVCSMMDLHQSTYHIITMSRASLSPTLTSIDLRDQEGVLVYRLPIEL